MCVCACACAYNGRPQNDTVKMHASQHSNTHNTKTKMLFIHANDVWICCIFEWKYAADSVRWISILSYSVCSLLYLGRCVTIGFCCCCIDLKRKEMNKKKPYTDYCTAYCFDKIEEKHIDFIRSVIVQDILGWVHTPQFTSVLFHRKINL